MSANVVLVGGNACIPGLEDRLYVTQPALLYYFIRYRLWTDTKNLPLFLLSLAAIDCVTRNMMCERWTVGRYKRPLATRWVLPQWRA